MNPKSINMRISLDGTPFNDMVYFQMDYVFVVGRGQNSWRRNGRHTESHTFFVTLFCSSRSNHGGEPNRNRLWVCWANEKNLLEMRAPNDADDNNNATPADDDPFSVFIIWMSDWWVRGIYIEATFIQFFLSLLHLHFLELQSHDASTPALSSFSSLDYHIVRRQHIHYSHYYQIWFSYERDKNVRMWSFCFGAMCIEYLVSHVGHGHPPNATRHIQRGCWWWW